MNKKLEKILEFNGKRISILLADGTWWVAIKPICEALNVDYEAQRKNIQSDEILSELPSEQTVVAADGKVRKMLCIPEMFVYGWLFSIRSESPELQTYKRKCYEVLYLHFHGALTGRMNALTEKSDTELRMIELQERLEQEMKESEAYKEMQDLKRKQKDIAKKLKDLDTELMTGQLTLF